MSAAGSVAFAWPAWTRGALVLAFGLVILASGIYIYMSEQLPRGYVNFFRAVPFYYRGSLCGFVPYGLGVSLIGIADIVRRQPYSDALLYIGLISIGIGLLVVFWHPNWMRPKCMRDRRYD